MTRITLASKPHRIKKVLKSTKAKVFSEFREGDLLTFSTNLKNNTGASGGGNYATGVTIRNLTQGLVVTKYQSELVNLLDRLYELELPDND